MKNLLLLSLLFLLSLIVVNTNGQSIIIVTDDAAIGQLYADDLIANGYTVEIKTDLAVDPSEDQIAALDAADLIIITRNTNSANYNYPAVWNNIDTPILLLSCFMTRSSRLSWLNTTATLEADGMEVTIIDDKHPIFKDIDVSTGTLAINATTPLHTNPIADAGNGTILAVSATTGNIVIAEWPKDTEFFTGSGYYATEYRAVFFTGLAYDFTDVGKTLFLNMANYILNPEEVSVKRMINNKINVYPLPIGNTLKIEGDFSKNANYEIVSLSGQVLISSNLRNNSQINTSGLKPGMYVLKISTNNQLISRKIVKN